MAKVKPDKELKRLQHELEKERLQHLETQKQLQININQLDTIDRHTHEMEHVQAENKSLKAKLESEKEYFEEWKTGYKKGVVEGVRKGVMDSINGQKQVLQTTNESGSWKPSDSMDGNKHEPQPLPTQDVMDKETKEILHDHMNQFRTMLETRDKIQDNIVAKGLAADQELKKLERGMASLVKREENLRQGLTMKLEAKDHILAKAQKGLVDQKKKLEDKDLIISKVDTSFRSNPCLNRPPR